MYCIIALNLLYKRRNLKIGISTRNRRTVFENEWKKMHELLLHECCDAAFYWLYITRHSSHKVVVAFSVGFETSAPFAADERMLVEVAAVSAMVRAERVGAPRVAPRVAYRPARHLIWHTRPALRSYSLFVPVPQMAHHIARHEVSCVISNLEDCSSKLCSLHALFVRASFWKYILVFK